jgi:hypothetical protein
MGCTEPKAMLEFVRDAGGLGERKTRLFAVACCRRVWHLLQEGRTREAVLSLERYADGAATAQELTAAALQAHQVAEERRHADDSHAAAAVENALYADVPVRYRDEDEEGEAAPRDVIANAVDAAFAAAWAAAHDVNRDEVGTTDGWFATMKAEEAEQCRLARCIYGSQLFRRPPSVDPLWLTWKEGTIPKMVRFIYDERCFAALSVLADALEEAGCTDGELLSHCRGPGPHFRGCWIVDLLLGKH